MSQLAVGQTATFAIPYQALTVFASAVEPEARLETLQPLPKNRGGLEPPTQLNRPLLTDSRPAELLSLPFRAPIQKSGGPLPSPVSDSMIQSLPGPEERTRQQKPSR